MTRDLANTIGEVLGAGLMAHDGVYRGDAITELLGSVERAEQNAKVLSFVYRCQVCGERLVPEEDLIFRDGNVFHCVQHRTRYDQSLFCAVAGCANPPLCHGTLCKEHQVEYAFGDLRFEENK